MNYIIENGHVLDPDNNIDSIMNVYVKDGLIESVGEEPVGFDESSYEKIDAKGLYVMPGFIDLHVHLREPGGEYKETIRTGTMAAARGGFTGVCPMPNTSPAIDSAEMIKKVNEIAEKDSPVHVYPIGAITVAQAGKELADLKGMAEAGCIGFSEDGKSVMDSSLYLEAMEIAKDLNLPVMAHCEDKTLVKNGAINKGKKSEELGVYGIPNAVEDIIVARDILLAKESGVHLHLCHCTTTDSVKMVKMAKEDGVSVSAEVCPHHFTLSDEDIPGDDANYKMNPPLRAKEDVEAVKVGLRENIMEVISTDHAPHSEEEKKRPIKNSPFGIVGLETAFSLGVTELVKKGYLTPLELVRRMSSSPAKIIGVKGGNLSANAPADITIADFDGTYTIDKNSFASKGKNTPFDGMKVYGEVKYTIVSGNIVYKVD